MEKLRIFYLKYKHAIPLIIYGIIYMAWFAWLEKNTTGHYRIIHMAADDYIPFCEVFVIPYFLWFAYVSAVVIYFFFKNKEDYYRTCIFLFTGMTIFLIVSTLWPSIHVYNSLGAHFAIIRSKCFEKKKGIRIGSLILAVSIIMATMFIKQHSVFDVLTAFVMAAVMYTLVYRYDLLIAVREFRNKRKAKPQIG